MPVFDPGDGCSVAQLHHYIKIMELAGRYDDMAFCTNKLVRQKLESSTPELTDNERNWVSVAYKNVVGSKRTGFRVISSSRKQNQTPEEEAAVKEYRALLCQEVEKTCCEVLKLTEELSKHATIPESQVYYYKMNGDYKRYLAEVSEGDTRERIAKESQDYYQKATEAAKDLPPTNPIRLGLALNYSVFFYEILNDPKEACKLAKESFDAALTQLDSLHEDSYKDSTLIMQLLRDNLTLWTTDQADQEDGDAGDG